MWRLLTPFTRPQISWASETSPSWLKGSGWVESQCCWRISLCNNWPERNPGANMSGDCWAVFLVVNIVTFLSVNIYHFKGFIVSVSYICYFVSVGVSLLSRSSCIIVQLSFIQINTTEEARNPTNPFRFANIGVEKFLELNSEQNHDDYCLAYVFSDRDFDDGVLGLAWVGAPTGRYSTQPHNPGSVFLCCWETFKLGGCFLPQGLTVLHVIQLNSILPICYTDLLPVMKGNTHPWLVISSGILFNWDDCGLRSKISTSLAECCVEQNKQRPDCWLD